MQKFLRTRIGLLITSYAILIVLFIIQKPLFMLFTGGVVSATGCKDWLNVILFGLPMDFSIAGYLMVVPAIIFLISVFSVKYLKKILNIYYLVISILISVVFIPNIVLYPYWGFPIDSTVFTYLSSPAGVVASIPVYMTVLVILIIAIYSFLQYLLLKKVVVDNFPDKVSSSKVKTFILLFVSLSLLFIPIRGGITTSTMNVSRVYFSENMYLNHSAINPLFNILYSLKLNTDLSSEYHFMDDGQAQLTFNRLMEHDKGAEVPELLKTDRPNIIFVILESFGANIIEPLGGVKDVAPNMNKLTEEGIFFRNLYVSSFRTDRGIVATLGGYPAQPTMSILKYPKKVQALNSIPKSLVDNGYSASFLYGGDVNFAQMKTFFVTQKVTDITTDTDFPIKDRLTKWGVPDAITFEKFYEDIKNEQSKPYLKMFLTLSSHEPFDVPTKRFEEPFLNSVAYTDSCIGVFVDKLKSSPDWNNTLIIFIPDHCMRYPKTVEYNEPERHQSFSLWIGGALKDTLKIDKCCSQIDMVATLLHQLHIDHKDFIFSKNVLNPTTKDFAFYSFSDGFGMLSDSSQVVYDNNSKQVIMSKGIHADSLLLEGKAFLQYLYRDIDSK